MSDGGNRRLINKDCVMVFVGRKEEPRSVAALDDGRQKGLVASSALYGKGAVSVGLTGG
jgi:hypothetical protein